MTNDEKYFILDEKKEIEDDDKLYRYSCFIRVISFIDFFMSMLNLTLVYPYALIVPFTSLCGYFGAVKYNKNFLQIYILYQCLKITMKGFYLYYVINEKISIVVIASGMYDGYIVYVTHKFINLLN
jgi:hypothetical protein